MSPEPEEDVNHSLPSKAVRKTRKQLAKEAREAKKILREEELNEKALLSEVKANMMPIPVKSAEESQPEEETTETNASAAPEESVKEAQPQIVEEQVEQQADAVVENAIEVPAPVPSLAPNPIPKSPLSERRQPQNPIDAIDAIDALQDALEAVGNALPPLDSPISPVKQTRKAKLSVAKTRSVAAPPVVRKPVKEATSSARPSPSATKVAPAKGKASVTSKPALGRSMSVRTAKPAAPATDSNPGSETKTKSTTDFLASKRRPVSVSFPAPPPPIKSAKAPTKPTFQLSSDAVAAKLKAAREERQKRIEAAQEEAEKKEPKARVVRSSAAAPTVKHTAASKAREGVVRTGERSVSSPNAHKRTTSIVTSVKPAGTDSKRSSMMGSRITAPTESGSTPKKAAESRARPSSIIVSRPATTVTSKPRPSSMIVSKSSVHGSSHNLSVLGLSSSTTVNTALKPRIPSNSSVKSTVTAQDVVAQKAKGREIFNRDKMEKESREKEKREKEDAARKARAAAAERGRQASREWAEKQKAKMIAMKRAAENKLGFGESTTGFAPGQAA